MKPTRLMNGAPAGHGIQHADDVDVVAADDPAERVERLRRRRSSRRRGRARAPHAAREDRRRRARRLTVKWSVTSVVRCGATVMPGGTAGVLTIAAGSNTSISYGPGITVGCSSPFSSSRLTSAARPVPDWMRSTSTLKPVSASSPRQIAAEQPAQLHEVAAARVGGAIAVGRTRSGRRCSPRSRRRSRCASFAADVAERRRRCGSCRCGSARRRSGSARATIGGLDTMSPRALNTSVMPIGLFTTSKKSMSGAALRRRVGVLRS